MRAKLKRRLKVFCWVALAAFVGINALAYRHAYAMMHFSTGTERTDKPEKLSFGQKLKVLLCGVTLPRPHTNTPASALGPDCKPVVIPETNGIKLGAWYCPGASSNTLVILFHGYAGEKTGMLPDAKAFAEMGFSTLLVDFRGSGDSSESYTTIGYDEADDVAASVTYARQHLDCSRLILYGASMGAAAVLRAVHSCGVRPDAIIVEAVFDRLLNTVRHRFEAMGVPSFPSAQLLVFWGGVQAGFNGLNHNPADYAASVRCPILFLHGGEDPRAHVEEARQVFNAVPGPKFFKEFAGLGHEAAVVKFPDDWKLVVGNFLEQRQHQAAR